MSATYGEEPDYSEAQWGYLQRGIMAEFPAFGLIHFVEPDPDLLLARRAVVPGAR